MGYLYLICVALMFSFGGTCAKLIGPYFGANYITFFRFFFGVFFLLVLKVIRRQRFRAEFRQMLRECAPWLLMGAAAKALAYLTENYGLTHGVSYGNILTQPAQTVFITCMSVFVLRERITWKKALFLIPCVLGVLIVAWNGRSLDDFLHGNLLLTGLFIVSGVFAGAHVFAQKKVADRMDILDSNLTMFSISAVLSFIPTIPSTAFGALTGVRPDLACILAMLACGFITGIAFSLNAKAIPLVPFYMVPIIQSSMAIFAILWGILFFHEPVSVYIVGGTLIFIAGIIGLQLADSGKKAHPAPGRAA